MFGKRMAGVVLLAAVGSAAAAGLDSTVRYTFPTDTAAPTVAGGTFSPFYRAHVEAVPTAGWFDSDDWYDGTEQYSPGAYDPGQHVGFSFTVAPGCEAAVESLTCTVRASAETPGTFRILMSGDGFVGDFVDLGMRSLADSGAYTETFDFADRALAAGDALAFRWIVWGKSAVGGGGMSNAGTFAVDDVYLTGTVTPEPATMGLLAIGGLALLRRRRRRRTGA